MQDLAALMDRLPDQSAGYELRFRVSPEVAADAPREVRAALDRLLAKSPPLQELAAQPRHGPMSLSQPGNSARTF